MSEPFVAVSIPRTWNIPVELAERYMSVAKLEIVLQNEQVDLVKATILKTARTGRKGDGLVHIILYISGRRGDPHLYRQSLVLDNNTQNNLDWMHRDACAENRNNC